MTRVVVELPDAICVACKRRAPARVATLQYEADFPGAGAPVHAMPPADWLELHGERPEYAPGGMRTHHLRAAVCPDCIPVVTRNASIRGEVDPK